MVTATFRTMLACVLAALACFAMPRGAAADGVEISASLVPEKIVLGDVARYTVVVDGTSDGDFSPPPLDKVPNLKVLSGPETSQQMSMVGSTMSIKHSISYTVRAVQEGAFRIPGAAYTVGGKRFEAAPIDGAVVPVPKVDPTDPSSVVSAITENADVNRQLEGRYFMVVEVPTVAYAEQVLTVSCWLYRDPRLPQPVHGAPDRPTTGSDFMQLGARDFWGSRTGLPSETVEWNGKKYQRSLLQRSWYAPTRGGKLNFLPPAFNVAIPIESRRGGDLFGFMDQRTITAALRARPIAIEVRDLPPPPPGAVARIVGDVKVTARVDREAMPQHEYLTYTVTVEGEGNLNALAAPTLPEIPGLSLVDSRPSGRVHERTDRYMVTRSFEYVFLAREAGKIAIPALTFAVQPPDGSAAQLARTPALTVNVTPVATSAITLSDAVKDGPGTTAKAGAQRMGQDVAFIDRSPLSVSAPRLSDRPIFFQGWFWALQAAIPALALIAGLLERRVRTADRSSAAWRAKTWERESTKALREAKANVGAGAAEFYGSIHRGVMSFAAARLGRPPAGLTAEEALHGLQGAGTPPDTIEALRRILTRADEARFAPVADDANQRETLLTEAQRALAAVGGGAR